jgi:glycosyltransferase involved in cell wall biosynthesis
MTSAGIAESRSDRPRLLMLAPSPAISGPVPGPIAKLAYRLVDALESAGYQVDTELWGRHQRDERPVRKILGRAADLLRIQRRIAQGSYDLVFIHTTHDARAFLRDLLLVLPSPASVRWVLLVHGSRFQGAGRLLKLGTRLLARRASAVLLLSSEELAEWHSFYPPGHYSLVSNVLAPLPGADGEPSFETRPQGVPELLFVGRLIREKGIYDLVEAFSTLRSKRACHLTFAGEGPEAEELQARASQLGVADDVELTGHLHEDELARLYRRADVLVLPTYFGEGLPTVLLEAMSVGLPIVTTRIRGAADHLVEGENALFVPPRQPDALAEALDGLLDDDALRSRMGENNLRKAEDFSPARVVEAYLRVFEDVVGREGLR